MRKLVLMSLMAMVLVSGSAMAGENSVIAALEQDGVNVVMMNNSEMEQVKGTGFYYGNYTLPYTGLNTTTRVVNVTYYGWGSASDYRRYTNNGAAIYNNQYVESDSPRGELFGDVYMTPNGVIEYHLVELTPTEYNGYVNWVKTGYYYLDSGWNRPLSTYNW